MTYESNTILAFASKLERRADSIVTSYCMLGLVAGAAGGYLLKGSAGGDYTIVILLCAVAGAVIGYVVGDSKSFMLRVIAQLSLCFLQIEINTRTRSGSQDKSPGSSQVPSGTNFDSTPATRIASHMKSLEGKPTAELCEILASPDYNDEAKEACEAILRTRKDAPDP